MRRVMCHQQPLDLALAKLDHRSDHAVCLRLTGVEGDLRQQTRGLRGIQHQVASHPGVHRKQADRNTFGVESDRRKVSSFRVSHRFSAQCAKRLLVGISKAIFGAMAVVKPLIEARRVDGVVGVETLPLSRRRASHQLS